jgi:hypothetical protein
MAAQKNYAVWVYGLVLELFLTTIETSVLVFTCCKQNVKPFPDLAAAQVTIILGCAEAPAIVASYCVEVRDNTCSTETGDRRVSRSVLFQQCFLFAFIYRPRRKADKA